MPKSKTVSFPQAIRHLLFVLFISSALSGAHAAGTGFDEANQLYDQGKFQEAKQRYEQLISSGGNSANLFYNLGNAEYRLGAKGRAILDYERALVLDPAHPEAQANLKLARDQAGAHLLPANWFHRALLPWSADAYTIIAAVSVWIVILSFASMWLWRRGESPLLWAALLLGLMAAGYSGLALWRDWQDRSLGIVTAKEAVARLAPADREGIAENLPEGSRVAVLSERGDWVYCELPGRGRGWLPAGAVEKVRGNAL